jgi:hypothetical protein
MLNKHIYLYFSITYKILIFIFLYFLFLCPYNADFKKDFEKTEIYKETIEEIKAALIQIRVKTEKTSDEFNSIDFNNVLAELENCDFNDSYYLEQARQKHWKIVTDDADLFKNNKLNVEIITANIQKS